MAVPPQYQADPVRRAMPLPGVSNEGGRALARGISQLGAVGVDAVEWAQAADARIAAMEYERERQDQTADFAARFAEARTGLAQRIDEARAQAPAGAKGHAAQVKSWWEEARNGLVESVTNGEARQSAMAMLADYGGNLLVAESRFETVKGIEKRKTDYGLAAEGAALIVGRDPGKMLEERDRLRALAPAMGLGEDETAALQRYGDQVVAKSLIRNTGPRDPAAAQALLANPEIQTMLGDADLVTQLGREVGVEQRRAEAETEAAAAAARAEARDSINALQRRIATGVAIPDAELEAAQKLAAGAGLETDVFDLGAARVKNDLNRVYQNASPAQIDAALKGYERKLAGAGDKAEVADQIAANHLRETLARRSSEEANDPWMAAARQGVAFDPVDMADPRSIDARARAVATARARGIEVPWFSDEEAAARTRTYQAGGLKERLATVDELRRIPDARARAAAARQVAGDDNALRYALSLRPAVAELVMHGQEAIKARQGIVPDAKADEAFRAHVRGALKPFGGEMWARTQEAAGLIYAALATRNGWTGEFNQKLYSQAVNAALGANGDKGGVGQWGGFRVMLPQGMTNAELNARLENMEGLLSDPRGPRSRDGSPVGWVPFRRQFHPVMVGEGLYRFETANGQVLKNAAGRDFKVEIWKLPPRRGQAANPAPAQPLPPNYRFTR